MKIKVGSVIIGFILICIGIATIAGQVAFLGIHPVVWFILGALLICSDSAWEKLAHAKRGEHKDPAEGEASESSKAVEGSAAANAETEPAKNASVSAATTASAPAATPSSASATTQAALGEGPMPTSTAPTSSSADESN